MLILHGLLAGDSVHAWAEDAHAATHASRRPGRRPALPPHPFAAPADRVRQALGPIDPTGCALPDGEVDGGQVALVLPTRRGLPLPSPETPEATGDGRPAGAATPVTLARWRVPAVPLVTGRLLWSAVTGSPAADVVPGADWRHLAELAAFADDLAARGRVLPVVVPGDGAGPADGRAHARWRPVLTREDAAWARALASAAPPSLAAGAAPDGGGSTRDVVAALLDVLVDAAVRRRLTGDRPAHRPDALGAFAAATTTRATARGTAATATVWVRALRDRDDGAFAATGAEVRRLSADLAEWQRDALGRPARARFRLVEPPEIVEPVVVVPAAVATAAPTAAAARTKAADGPDPATAPWLLEFGLQATREPSVVADAADVWTGGGATAALGRFVESPQQALLAELGRAQRLLPAVGRALRGARPTALELDPAGAHDFLTTGAATLAAAGFAVELPGWWGRPAARLGARLTAGTPAQPGIVAGTSVLGQAAVVDYRWQVALGDHTLTEDELTALAALQQPLIRLRGQWVEVDASALARALTAMQRDGSGQMSVGELFAALGSGEAGPGGLPVLDVEAEGWLGDLLSGAAERRIEPVAVPASFRGQLRPYQERGLAWLTFLDRLGLGAVLADDMGLGKTVQLLALLAGDLEPAADAGATTGNAGDVGPTLLVCPMSLVGNWQREATKFAPSLRVHVHHGSDRAKGEAFASAVAASDLVVTTYAIAARDAEQLGAVHWRRVVLDEAQAVKNAATRQAQAVRALPAVHRIAVTGTPVENRLADLWSIMEFANPGILGGATAFKQRYAVPIERHGDDAAAARLRTLTQPFVLRRLKTDRSIISDLPEKLEMEVFCSLTAEQAALYQAVVDDMLDRIENSEGIERRGLVLATMTRLKQVCNHPAQVLRDGSRLAGRSGKLARVEETLEEVLAAGEKALLFTQFAEFGGMLRAHLSATFGREVLFLHGGVAKADRDTMVARFQSPDAGSPAIFVLSLKAGGTGLNLTAANHVLHVDRWWNPAVEDQATDRAFRIGQTRAVQVRKLVVAGTLEERIAAMIADKRGLAARIVGTGEGWLTELSTEQLRDLLRLDTSAVAE